LGGGKRRRGGAEREASDGRTGGGIGGRREGTGGRSSGGVSEVSVAGRVLGGRREENKGTGEGGTMERVATTTGGEPTRSRGVMCEGKWGRGRGASI
jgi:hypothetical protein